MPKHDRLLSLYNAAAWGMPVFDHDSAADALSTGGMQDGISRFKLPNGQTLDLCLKGFSKLRKSYGGNMLIVFGGAVSDRKSKLAPFFSGAGIGKDLGLPTIAVADPALELHEELALAWYAGSSSIPTLQSIISDVLHDIVKFYDANPILVGGSGGGFAALTQASLLKRPATVLVWNPQTSISEYTRSAVENYIAHAFPASEQPQKNISQLEFRKTAQIVFGNYKLIHDLTSRTMPSQIKVIYLQNQADWHVEKHAKPYLNQYKWNRLSDASFTSSEESHLVYWGAWGTGHAAPNRKSILTVLNAIKMGHSLPLIAESLDRHLLQNDNSAPFFDWPAPSPSSSQEKRWEVEVVEAESSLKIILKLSGIDQFKGCKFAFYILENNVRVYAREYTDDASIEITTPTEPARLEVVAFVRDSLGNRETKKTLINHGGQPT